MQSQSSSHANTPVLWGVKLSPYVKKVQIFLAEKKIPYNHQEVLPEGLAKAMNQALPAEFSRLSPLGKIPALAHGAVALADSAVICTYLDRTFQHTPSLYPATPLEAAQARWFEQYADNELGALTTKVILTEQIVKPALLDIETDQNKIQEAYQTLLPKHLNYLEQCLQGKRWLVGDKFSIADIAMLTHFITLQLVKYPLDAKQYPNLTRYVTAGFERPALQGLLPVYTSQPQLKP